MTNTHTSPAAPLSLVRAGVRGKTLEIIAIAASTMAVSASVLAQPANDSCANATPIGNGQVAFTTVNATHDYTGPCDQESTAGDVWFDYVAPQSGFTKIRPGADAPADIGVTVLDGSCDAPELVCAADFMWEDDTRQVVFPVIAGNHYLIRLHDVHANAVSGHIVVSTATPPTNDECATATTIGGTGVFSFDNTLANNSGPDDAPLCDGFGGMGIAHDVWFRWTNTLPAGQDAVISLCGGTRLDTKIAVYHDGCPVGAPLDCNDDFCFLESRATFTPVPGLTYLIRIGVWPGMGGEAAPDGKPGTFTVSAQPSCTVVQGPGSVVEPEPCGQSVNDGWDADCTNGGRFTDITVNGSVTVFGTAPVINETPDQDYYRVTLTQPTRAYFSGLAEFPMVLGILDTQCPPNLYIRNRFPYQPCEDPAINPLYADLEPGEYVFAVVNSRTASDCSAHNNYAVTISLEPCVAAAVTGDPVDQTACGGTPAQFTVTAMGNNLFYQWAKDGTEIFDDPGHISGSFTDHLTIESPTADDVGSYTCRVTNACGAAVSNPAQLSLGGSCGAADLGGPGGLPVACGDGVLDNNDFIAFINYFFAGDTHADVGAAGGVNGHDGSYDNNDFVAFIDLFFAGCH